MEVKFDHDKLKTLRKKQKLSQSRLAELSGTTDRYIRFMEKGKKTNPYSLEWRRSKVSIYRDGISCPGIAMRVDYSALTNKAL